MKTQGVIEGLKAEFQGFIVWYGSSACFGDNNTRVHSTSELNIITKNLHEIHITW